MNKKGFAISVILYSVVFLIIAILYMLLGLTKTRYTVNKNLRDNLVNELNIERSEVEYTSSEVCVINGSQEYTTDLTITIKMKNKDNDNYQNDNEIKSYKYKFNDGSWSSNNSISVDHAGIYIGYFRDANGGVGTCSADVTSKTIYRYRDCDTSHYIYGEYYYDGDEQKRDIIGCNFSNEEWGNWSDTKPESKVTRQIEARTSYKLK